jgi:hypothetical protein
MAAAAALLAAALLLAAAPTSSLAAAAGFACVPPNAPAECAALSALYRSTNGAAWRDAPAWHAAAAGAPTDICALQGVACTGGAVTALCVPALAQRRSDACAARPPCDATAPTRACAGAHTLTLHARVRPLSRAAS